jgi:hypothetical protein
MKYIKLFEKFDYDNLLEEVKDLAEQSLVYLIDDGLKIETKLCRGSNGKFLHLSIEPSDDKNSWDDIKNHMIPFFQLLERRYKLEDQSNNKSGRPYLIYDDYLNRIDYSLKYLCSDKRQDLFIRKISVVVEDKK